MKWGTKGSLKGNRRGNFLVAGKAPGKREKKIRENREGEGKVGVGRVTWECVGEEKKEGKRYAMSRSVGGSRKKKLKKKKKNKKS